MNGQLVFFADAAARRSDPGTSHAAAASLPSLSVLERQMLDAYRVACDFGLTDDELCARLNAYHPPTVKSCRSRLSNRGLLVPTGTTRPSTRGRHMQVWAVAS